MEIKAELFGPTPKTSKPRHPSLPSTCSPLTLEPHCQGCHFQGVTLGTWANGSGPQLPLL